MTETFWQRKVRSFCLPGRVGEVTDDGPFALVSRCRSLFRVYLHETADDRSRRLYLWSHHGCPAGAACKGLHDILTLDDKPFIDASGREVTLENRL